MGRPVVADEPRAVEDEADGEFLDDDVVHELVVAALEERRVDAAERLEPLDGQARRKGHGVLLGDPDVVRSLGEPSAEDVHARAARHGGRDADDVAVVFGDLDQLVREDRRQGRRLGRGAGHGDGLDLAARADVELGDAVHLVGGRHGGRVAHALLGLEVQQHGLVLVGRVAEVLEDGHQVVEVVPVDGADVVEPELLEERAAGDDAARVLVDARVEGLHLGRHEIRDLLGDVAEVGERLGRDEPRRVRRERARRDDAARARRARRERDLAVVVEHRDHARAEVVRVVHRLVGHAARDGAVADDGDAVVLGLFLLRLADRHAQRGRDGRRRVARAETVVVRLGALLEAREAALLAERGHAVAAAREDLVRVALVRDVPQDAVLGRVEDVVERDGELDDAERRAEMAARLGHLANDLPAQLVRELLELRRREPLHVRRHVDGVEQGRRRGAFVVRAIRRGLRGSQRRRAAERSSPPSSSAAR
mmetsp:Transcript_6569/g.27608  ORF Transcript_6569/g.27608 Transcript_6569/m.27608 type:complete len:481 (-) Transcript_6569:256-1698(-)